MSATEVTSPKRCRPTKYLNGNLRSTHRYRRPVKGYTRIVLNPVSADRKERHFLRAVVDVIFDKWEIGYVRDFTKMFKDYGKKLMADKANASASGAN